MDGAEAHHEKKRQKGLRDQTRKKRRVREKERGNKPEK